MNLKHFGGNGDCRYSHFNRVLMNPHFYSFASYKISNQHDNDNRKRHYQRGFQKPEHDFIHAIHCRLLPFFYLHLLKRLIEYAIISLQKNSLTLKILCIVELLKGLSQSQLWSKIC